MWTPASSSVSLGDLERLEEAEGVDTTGTFDAAEEADTPTNEDEVEDECVEAGDASDS